MQRHYILLATNRYTFGLSCRLFGWAVESSSYSSVWPLYPIFCRQHRGIASVVISFAHKAIIFLIAINLCVVVGARFEALANRLTVFSSDRYADLMLKTARSCRKYVTNSAKSQSQIAKSSVIQRLSQRQSSPELANLEPLPTGFKKAISVRFFSKRGRSIKFL